MIGVEIMLDTLKKLCNNGSLVGIYSDRADYDRFTVGYILAVTDEHILISHIGLHGEFDGYSVRETDSVYRVEEDSRYLKKLELLSKLNGEAQKTCPFDVRSGIMQNAIGYALKNNFIVKLSLDEDAADICGYITEQKNDIITVLQISEYGDEDGTTEIPEDEIQNICINDTDYTDLDKIYKYKKGITNK